ncbi:MAG: signal peptidase I [Oscillospiraceae bacterium]
MKQKQKEETPRTLAGELYFWLQTFAVGLTVLVLLMVFVGRPVVVDGSSMEPTLHGEQEEGRIRDVILIRSLFYTPRTGDVVVLHKDFDAANKPIVKRVIATEGQTIRIDYAAGTVTVDGVVLEEDYILEPMVQKGWQTITEMTVPEGSVFVMGDNRNVSADSRDATLGAVDCRYILGQAVAVVFPLQNIKGLL